jgi:hypothetical protein
MARLNVGAGARLLEGYINQDVQKLEGIDLVCEMFDLPKHVKDCDEIAAFHILEHFPNTVEVLKLWLGLLKEGGKLNIEVPNFRYHAQLCLAGSEEQAIFYCFGGQVDKWDFHYTSFTPEILKKRLYEAGFKNIEIREESSVIATAYK